MMRKLFFAKSKKSVDGMEDKVQCQAMDNEEGENEMTMNEAINIVTKLQNKKENWGKDILSICGFMDTVEEVLNHAKNNGWDGGIHA